MLTSLVGRLRSVPPVVLDALLTAGFLVLSQVEIRQSWDDGFRAGSVALNTPLVALLVAPLVLRTVAPRLGLLLMLLAGGLPGLVVAHTLLFWGGAVPLLMMVFAVARRDGGALGRLTWLAAGVSILTGARNPHWKDPSNLLFSGIVFGFAWAAGRLVRRGDLRRAALADALDRLSEEQAAREAEAVALERGRIASEMHDVVSHAVSLMVLQAGAARLALETAGTAPAQSAQLREAERTGRQALDELRRSLGVLRGAAS